MPTWNMVAAVDVYRWRRNMKIVKIIVDKKPRGCFECYFKCDMDCNTHEYKCKLGGDMTKESPVCFEEIKFGNIVSEVLERIDNNNITEQEIMNMNLNLGTINKKDWMQGMLQICSYMFTKCLGGKNKIS